MAIFNIGKTYTFDTLAPSILGASVKKVKLIGILDYNNALKYSNVDVIYRSVYPLLPSGTLNDPKAPIYYLFETESSGNVVYCEQWIDQPTVTEISSQSYRIIINNSSVQDIDTLKGVLNTLGFNDYSIEAL